MENDEKSEAYFEVERVYLSSVWYVFLAWAFRRKLRWKSSGLTVNGKSFDL